MIVLEPTTAGEFPIVSGGEAYVRGMHGASMGNCVRGYVRGFYGNL